MVADARWTREAVELLSGCRSYGVSIVQKRPVLVVNLPSGSAVSLAPEDGIWPREVLLLRPGMDPNRTYKNRTPSTIASGLVSSWQLDLVDLARREPDAFMADTGANNPFYMVFKGGHYPARVRAEALETVLAATRLSDRPAAWSPRFPSLTRGDILLDTALEAIPSAARFGMLKPVLLAFAGDASALLRPFYRLNALTGPQNRGRGWNTVLEEAVQYLHKPGEDDEESLPAWDWKDESDASLAEFLQAFLGKLSGHRTGRELLELFLGRTLTDMNYLADAFEKDCLSLTGWTAPELLARTRARQALDVPSPDPAQEGPCL
jgi:hypothetical protein